MLLPVPFPNWKIIYNTFHLTQMKHSGLIVMLILKTVIFNMCTALQNQGLNQWYIGTRNQVF